MTYNEKVYENAVQTMYLPEYTAVLRRVQGELDELLKGLGFAECLFPKLVEEESFDLLMSASPRLRDEWSREAVRTEEIPMGGRKRRFVLSHWQCEPFYFFVRKNPDREFRFFDHSGWSYRVERHYDDYRLFEFLRTEVVFCLKREKAEESFHTLIDALFTYLRDGCGLPVRLVEKLDEEALSAERLVLDIVLEEDGREIELVGSHLHGNVFLKALGVPPYDRYDTGCCGIGLSRIAGVLFSRMQKEEQGK